MKGCELVLLCQFFLVFVVVLGLVFAGEVFLGVCWVTLLPVFWWFFNHVVDEVEAVWVFCVFFCSGC